MKHNYGKFESVKFEYRRKDFYEYIDYLDNENISLTDLLEHFTAYVGHMSINRFLTLYEYYKKTINVAGHIAEIGIYKGAGTLFFAKLVKIFENESLTQVHGFDWFKGAPKGGDEDTGLVKEGSYQYSYNKLMELVNLQKLDHIIRIHNLDVITQIKSFFSSYKHLQFKMVFMDAGIYEVMKAAIPIFWERLTPGGIMVFDQNSHELGPGETTAIREFLPNVKIMTLQNTWMPNAYAVKS